MEYLDLILIPIVMGILEVVKKANINEKFIPVLAIILGLIFGILFDDVGMREGIIQGLYIGLSSVGLYSGYKNVKEGFVK